MPIFNFEFVVSGDLATAQSEVKSALEAADFTIQQERDHWKATHGSIAQTMFLGLLASAKNTREVLDVKFVDLGGTVKVELHRPIFQPSGGSDDGLEQVKLYEAYNTAVGQVRAQLQSRGVLVG
jgi:hypothetical protein